MFDFFKACPFSVQVCDLEGVVLYMNDASAALYADRGGYSLVGRNLFACHGPAAGARLRGLIQDGLSVIKTPPAEAYEREIIAAYPWMQNGELAGSIEFVFPVPPEDGLQEISKRGFTYWKAIGLLAKLFSADPEDISPVDLRSSCNRRLQEIGGDGKEGLSGMPDGLVSLRGIPFEIVDHTNRNASCIMLAGADDAEEPREVSGIDVGCAMASLYFLHTAVAGVEGVEVFRYCIRYTDGSTIGLPVIVGGNTGNYMMGAYKGEALIAWRSWKKEALYAWRWENSNPDVPIAAIDIVSGLNGPRPVVVAISGERAR